MGPLKKLAMLADNLDCLNPKAAKLLDQLISVKIANPKAKEQLSALTKQFGERIGNNQIDEQSTDYYVQMVKKLSEEADTEMAQEQSATTANIKKVQFLLNKIQAARKRPLISKEDGKTTSSELALLKSLVPNYANVEWPRLIQILNSIWYGENEKSKNS